MRARPPTSESTIHDTERTEETAYARQRYQQKGQESATLWVLTIDEKDVAAVYGLRQHG